MEEPWRICLNTSHKNAKYIDINTTNKHNKNVRIFYFILPYMYTGLILGLPPANERRRYTVTLSLIG